jgi:formylglycine-generating enzyme required for sulfatase activity
VNVFRNSFLLFFITVLTAVFGPAGFTSAAEKTYTNSIGMEFVLIPAGEFMMGSDKGKNPDVDDLETPQHRVRISKPFYLGKYEVTQAQWEAVMGNNPSEFKGRTNPVEQVYWDDAEEFIRRLNKKEGHNRYRLPTEAEWEYAARAGTTSEYSFGDNAELLKQYAWYLDNSEKKTHPVGQKQPNPWGLYDMHGNVIELVQDWFGEDYYSKSPSSDPRGPSSGDFRMLRGCCWSSNAEHCRSADRSSIAPSELDAVGFRLALSPK